MNEMHPAAALLESLALGRLDEGSFAEIEDHVTHCPDCATILAQHPEDSFTTLLRAARSYSDTAVPAADAATLATPMPAARKDFTAVWQDDAAVPLQLPAALADHPRYRPLRPLGEGGMGAVWLAEHKIMGRTVAVKVIRPEFLNRPGAAERFRREAQNAARLHHPNIVTAFDADQAGDTPLLAMEYVEGTSVADEVRRRGPLPVAEACAIIRQAALGLQHAHEKGLVHRDLKPQNLMRTSAGTVKILDFGLAVLHDAGPGQSGLTGANMVIGTPDYIAPEQAEDSRRADCRSDLYALGCTLYHLLTGRVPFPGDSVLRKLDAHRTQTPEPIRSLRPEIPEGLAAVVVRLMAKRPGDRYASAAAVAEALEPYTRAAVPPRQRRPFVAAALALLFAGIVTLAGAVFYIVTDNGTIEIRTEDKNIKVSAEHNGKTITLDDLENKQTWVVDTGTWTLRLANNPNGLEMDIPPTFTLKRGDRKVVTISKRPGVGPAAVAPLHADLAGQWHDTPEWSDIHLKPKADGYEGTYSATFNNQPGYLNITRTGPATFSGEWGESDRKYHGIFTIHAAPDGRSAKVSWEARDGRPRKGVSTWQRVQGSPGLAFAPFNAYQAQTYQQYWAQYLGVAPEITNSINMKMRLIPPGQFLMGSTTTPFEEPLRDMMVRSHGARDEFQHEVQISRPFYMAAHAVTVGQFRAFVKERGYKTEAETIGNAQRYGPAGVTEADPKTNWQNPGYAQTDDHPVTCVTWNDARAFCAWLSEKEGKKYALPTEAQWEYACRAGTHTRFYFGDDDKALGDHVWYALNAQFKTHPVGTKKSNAFGLYDMVGNVWQWTADHYQDGYYQKSPRIDPPGAEADAAEQRVVFRGGSWVDGWQPAAASGGSWLFRSAHRQLTGEQLRSNNIGFRVALVVDQKPINSIDLLPLVDPKVDAIRGNWRLDKGSLFSGKEPEARLALPVQPLGDYHFLVKFARLDEDPAHALTLSLPAGQGHVQFSLDSHSGRFSALESVDGCFVDNPQNPTQVRGRRTVTNKVHTLEGHVRSEGDRATIRIDLDGKNLVNFSGDRQRFWIHPEWSIGDDRRLGLRVWDSNTRIDALQLRMLSGEAKLLRQPKAPDAAAANELAKWQGVWKVQEASPGIMRTDRLTIDGNRWSAEWGPNRANKWGGSIKIVEIKKDMTLVDLINAQTGQTCRSIYKVDGDMLYYCGSYFLPRPTEFMKNLGDPVYIEWKRVGKPFEPAWVPLFNGKDLAGWDVLWNARNWFVQGGMLIGAGEADYVMTKRNDFENFHLRVEAKINKGGNSGVLFRCPPPPQQPAAGAPPVHGYETDIDGGGPHPKNAGFLAVPSGSLWQFGKPAPKDGALLHEAQKEIAPVDTWFMLEVIANGNHIVTKVNGQKVTDLTDNSHSKGRIALMLRGGDTRVSFRKVEIKELPPFGRFVNSLGMEFARIPKGKAWLGGTRDSPAKQEVTIPHDFFLGVYEVTQEQWQAVKGAHP